jgi:hypothetical protein
MQKSGFPRNNILQFFLFKVSARLSFHVVCKIGLKEKLSFGRWHGQVGLYGGLMRVLINEFLIVEKFREKLVRSSL